MRRSKLFALAAMAAGMMFSTTTARAEDRDWDRYRDMHNDRRDLRHDYDNVARLRADMARDQYRLNEDLRCGRYLAARQDSRDLARDQRALDSQMRDIHHDRNDLYRDRQDQYWDRR